MALRLVTKGLALFSQEKIWLTLVPTFRHSPVTAQQEVTRLAISNCAAILRWVDLLSCVPIPASLVMLMKTTDTWHDQPVQKPGKKFSGVFKHLKSGVLNERRKQQVHPFSQEEIHRFWQYVKVCEHGKKCEICCWE